jgi:hypothetical protein
MLNGLSASLVLTASPAAPSPESADGRTRPGIDERDDAPLAAFTDGFPSDRMDLPGKSAGPTDAWRLPESNHTTPHTATDPAHKNRIPVVVLSRSLDFFFWERALGPSTHRIGDRAPQNSRPRLGSGSSAQLPERSRASIAPRRVAKPPD